MRRQELLLLLLEGPRVAAPELEELVEPDPVRSRPRRFGQAGLGEDRRGCEGGPRHSRLGPCSIGRLKGGRPQIAVLHGLHGFIAPKAGGSYGGSPVSAAEAAETSEPCDEEN